MYANKKNSSISTAVLKYKEQFVCLQCFDINSYLFQIEWFQITTTPLFSFVYLLLTVQFYLPGFEK